MITAILSLTVLGLALGLLLGYAAQRLAVETNPLAEEIAALLPGSQCGQCGYPGCGAGAVALAAGEAPVTLCPPGGRAVAQQIAEKLGVQVDLSGVEDTGPRVAHIREAICTGCTRCRKVCPTDAILGAPKHIHVVIRDVCTGCGLCVDLCPTECLSLSPEPVTLQSWYWSKPALAA